MKNIDEIINELNKNTNYEKILCEIINSKENTGVQKTLTEIYENKHLTQEQKDKICFNIYDYTKKICDNFKDKTETIYIKGFKEGTVTSLILDKMSKNNSVEKDELLDLAIDDFINTRLQEESILDKNIDYIKNKNKINTIKKNINKENLKIIEQLEDCYECREDLSNIQAYKIGFEEAIKLLYKTNNKLVLRNKR